MHDAPQCLIDNPARICDTWRLYRKIKDRMVLSANVRHAATEKQGYLKL